MCFLFLFFCSMLTIDCSVFDILFIFIVIITFFIICSNISTIMIPVPLMCYSLMLLFLLGTTNWYHWYISIRCSLNSLFINFISNVSFCVFIRPCCWGERVVLFNVIVFVVFWVFVVVCWLFHYLIFINWCSLFISCCS